METPEQSFDCFKKVNRGTEFVDAVCPWSAISVAVVNSMQTHTRNWVTFAVDSRNLASVRTCSTLDGRSSTRHYSELTGFHTGFCSASEAAI